MKRSEMVTKIIEHISNNVKYYYKIGVNFTESEANDLLNMLEEAGMLPPNNCSKKCHEENYENCGNQWEPEDSTAEDPDDADNYCGAV